MIFFGSVSKIVNFKIGYREILKATTTTKRMSQIGGTASAWLLIIAAE